MANGYRPPSKRKRDEDESVSFRSLVEMPGRFIGGAVTSVDDIVKGLGKMGGAVLSDTVGAVGRGLVPGGHPGFWQGDESQGLGGGSAIYQDMLKPIGKSLANTADTIIDLSYIGNALFKGVDQANTEALERLRQLHDDPFFFTLEHVGNVAIVGAVASKPAMLGVAASRGGPTGAAAAKGLRPLAGRGARAKARGVVHEAAEEAAGAGKRVSAPQVARFTEDIVGHPYRTTFRKFKGSRAGTLLRDPQAFDPVTGVENTTNIADETAGLWEPSSGPEGFRYEVATDQAIPQIRAYDPDGNLVGSAQVKPGDLEQGIFNIQHMEVDEVLRGQGIGRRLGEEAYRYAEQEGLELRAGDVVNERLIGTLEEAGARRVPSEEPPAGAEGPGPVSGVWVGSGKVFFEDSPVLKRGVEWSDAGRTRIEQRANRLRNQDSLSLNENAELRQLEQTLNTWHYMDAPVEVSEGFQGLAPTYDMGEAFGQLKAKERLIQEPKNQAVGVDPARDLNMLDRFAQRVGQTLEDVRKSETYQRRFGEEARTMRRLGRELREGEAAGTGHLAEQVSNKLGRQVGSRHIRRKLEPDFTERTFLRDVKNMQKRLKEGKAGQYAGVIKRIQEHLDIDELNIRNVAGRTGQVLRGQRAVGQTVTPEQLFNNIRAVIDEVKREGMPPGEVGRVLDDILPDVDPLSVHLLGLNAIERMRGLPDDSLTSALIDSLEMGKYGELGRRAQRAGAEAPERFRRSPEELEVDLDALRPAERQMFDDALTEYRRQLQTREPRMVEEGLIPEAGTRLGRSVDEPTQFSTELGDLNLTRTQRGSLRKLSREKKKAGTKVENLAARRDALQPRFARGPGGKMQLHKGYKDALKRISKEMGKAKEQLVIAASRLENAEQAAVTSLEAAPSTARNLLTYAREVAPQQAQQLRAMADEGQVGDPTVLRNLADELDDIPKDLQALNDADTFIAYIRNIKERGDSPGVKMPASLSTRKPGASKRRGTATDIDYDRDFRARTFWQEQEFQSYMLSRQADEFVRKNGYAKDGKSRLKELNYTDDVINGMSRNQVQQALESHGLKVYQPEQLFGTARRPSGNVNPIDADWISPWADQALRGALEKPGWWEKVLAEGVWDPVTNAWKVWALPLRLAWQVNNFAGGALLTMLSGEVSPLDYPSLMRASWHAVHDWNRGMRSQVRVPLSGTYRNDLVKTLQRVGKDSDQGRAIQHMLDEDAIILTNDVLTDISQSGITRGDFAFLNNSQFLRDIGGGTQSILDQFNLRGKKVQAGPIKGGIAARQRFANLRQTGREVVDSAYHLNELVDNLHRTAVYIDQMGKGVSHQQAMSQVVKALGDYNKLSGFEKRFVKRIYPFYPWMRHVTEVTARSLHPSNINRTVIFAHLMHIMAQPNEFEEMLPEWAGGHIFTGMSEDGTPKFLSTRGLNPFLDVFDPLAQPNMAGLLRPIHPGIQMGYEKVSGISTLTGRPFSSPVDPADGRPARPGVGEQLTRRIPQAGALRDVYRDIMGQPLTRYGTGEPAFFPGAEEGKTGMQSVTQLFGANVQPLDVENMKYQEKLREYRELTQRKRQAAQEERHGGRSLSDLPLVPG